MFSSCWGGGKCVCVWGGILKMDSSVFSCLGMYCSTRMTEVLYSIIPKRYGCGQIVCFGPADYALLT